MTIRFPPRSRLTPPSAADHKGTLETFDLDDFPLVELSQGQQFFPTPTSHGIDYIIPMTGSLVVPHIGPGSPYASGRVITVVADGQSDIGVVFKRHWQFLRFAYTWGATAPQSVKVTIYDPNEGTLDTVAVNRTGDAQWVEYKAPTEGMKLLGFGVPVFRDGRIDNISVY
jgi:hypothetical protein